MSTDEKKYMDTPKVTLETIRNWLVSTTRLFAKFALILIILGSALALSVTLHAPLYVSYLIILLVAAVLFIMLIMVSIKNIVYLYLKSSVWGQIVLYLLVALVSAMSYLWSIGEINRIFLVDPSNLGLTTTVLTGIQFFKYSIMVLLGSYFIAIGLYFFYQRSDRGAISNDAIDKSVTDKSVSNIKALHKKMLSGILFAFTVTLCLLVTDKISKYSDVMIQAFALNIDFYSYHTCTGADFKDIEGVLFLSASDILVAKEIAPMQWAYKKVRCEP